MARRVVSLWFPRLATDRLRRAWRKEAAKGLPAGQPLAVCVEVGGRLLLGALDAGAERAGLRPGQPLADALALAPGLATVPADPAADRALLARLARWGWRFSPLAGVDGLAGLAGSAGLWLDVTGCAHLFGGERAMLDDLRARLHGMGFGVRAALAGTAGAAWALARFGGDGAVVAAGETRAALKGLPLAALRLDGATVAALERVGLRCIGDLAGIARASLASRFGRGLLMRLDQAMGEAGEALAFLPHVRPWRVRHVFPEPVAHVEAVAVALDGLLARLCRRLSDEDKGCRRLDLACRRVDGASPGVSIGTVAPVRDPVRLARLFAEKLVGIDAGFGIEALVLSAPVIEPMAPEQQTHDAERETVSGDLGALAERLANRLGAGRVTCAMAVDSHLPERAWRPAAFRAPTGGWARVAVDPPRPLRLLTHPAPLEALGPPLGGRAGDPPTAFGLGVVRHRVAAAEGPERIAPNWWRPDPAWGRAPRDYWRVEDAEGTRLWVFRLIGRDTRADRWFLHGVFG